MGSIADMMIEGTLDYQTGEYLGKGKGFPRTKNHRKSSPQLPKNANFIFKYKKGRKALNGVRKWLCTKVHTFLQKILNFRT